MEEKCAKSVSVGVKLMGRVNYQHKYSSHCPPLSAGAGRVVNLLERSYSCCAHMAAVHSRLRPADRVEFAILDFRNLRTVQLPNAMVEERVRAQLASRESTPPQSPASTRRDFLIFWLPAMGLRGKSPISHVQRDLPHRGIATVKP
jgi:hypothetical protein